MRDKPKQLNDDEIATESLVRRGKQGRRESRNCPINECTGDGTYVGRCWFHLPDGKTCPRHGDVSEAVEHYKATGQLTPEKLNA